MKYHYRILVGTITLGLLFGGVVQAANPPLGNLNKKLLIKKVMAVSKTISKKSIPTKTKLPMPKESVGATTLSSAQITKMIKLEIDTLIKEGKLAVNHEENTSFEKLHNLNRSYSEDTPGFQNYYIPAAAIAGIGTFFSAGNVGAENLNGTNLTSDNATLNSLTVSERTSLEGGLSLLTPEQGNSIDSDSGAYLSSGGTWTNASSKDLKEHFTELDQNDVLNKINALSITRWNYKKESASTTHIGPLAEDFYAAFVTGGSAGQKSISTIDPAGVALAGIQALSKKLLNLDWLRELGTKMGIVIEENIVKVKTLIAVALRTDSLEVGSSDMIGGITLYDKTTKQPVCVMVNSGAVQIEPGRCLSSVTELSTAGTTSSILFVQELPSLEVAASNTLTTIAPTEVTTTIAQNDLPAATEEDLSTGSN